MAIALKCFWYQLSSDEADEYQMSILHTVWFWELIINGKQASKE